MSTVQTKITLDLRGLNCPMPIVKTAKQVKQMNAGEAVEVLATDPGSVPDFNAWVKATGNVLLEQTEADGVYRFVIEKR